MSEIVTVEFQQKRELTVEFDFSDLHSADLQVGVRKDCSRSID